MTFLIAAAMSFCSNVPVWNAECDVACRWAGYDGGCLMAQDELHCACWDIKNYTIMTKQKRISIPKRSS